jgi:hypothetical protein
MGLFDLEGDLGIGVRGGRGIEARGRLERALLGAARDRRVHDESAYSRGHSDWLGHLDHARSIARWRCGSSDPAPAVTVREPCVRHIEEVRGTRYLPHSRKPRTMSFILGILLFVGVAGLLDAKLPWPKPRATSPKGVHR